LLASTTNATTSLTCFVVSTPTNVDGAAGGERRSGAVERNRDDRERALAHPIRR
jgi:hypothetical protein